MVVINRWDQISVCDKSAQVVWVGGVFGITTKLIAVEIAAHPG